MTEPELSEEEVRQLQAELDRISVDDVLIQTVITLLNVGARKGGLAGGDAPVDLGETRLAIEGARVLLPLLEERHGAQIAPVKDMLSQLQMAYAQRAGGGAAPEGDAPPGGAPEGGEAPREEPPGRREGGEPPPRLWVPGQ